MNSVRKITGVLMACAILTLSATRIASAEKMQVDLALVFAVDISSSMETKEQELQRNGYVAALRSPEFAQAIQLGRYKRVAITYMEWASGGEEHQVLPWTLIDDAHSAFVFSSALAESPIGKGNGTFMKNGLEFAAKLLATSGFAADRQVIDVSGDGEDSSNAFKSLHDNLVARDITINGLPITIAPDTYATAKKSAADNLIAYYRHCVIGGQGSFLVSIQKESDFVEATREKLVLEVSGLMPQEHQKPQIILVSNVQSDTYVCH